MKFRFMTMVVTLVLGVLFASCSDPKPMSGGVDGNPNYLQGRLLRPGSNQPAARVPVVLAVQGAVAARVLAADGWDPRDTVLTDSDGCYRFRIDADGAYRLQARVGDSLLLSSTVQVVASLGKRLADVVVALPPAKVLVVEDFEPKTSTSSLRAWFADAYSLRLLYNDSTRIGLSPAGFADDPWSGVESCAEHGMCLHFSTTSLVADATWDVTEVYSMFRPAVGDAFDLSEADSVSLLVRGTGTVRLGFWGKDAGLTKTDWSQISREFPLTGDWTRLTVATDSLRFDWGSDTIAWSGSRIHKILFGVKGQSEVWIDEIRLHGADVTDMQGP